MLDRVAIPLAVAVFVCAGTARSQKARPAECEFAPDLAAVEGAWNGVSPDPTADPARAGYGELLRFRIPESGVEGRAVFVRLAAQWSDATIFRGEKREWTLLAELDDGSFTNVYGYRNVEHLPDNWAYVPKNRRLVRV